MMNPRKNLPILLLSKEKEPKLIQLIEKTFEDPRIKIIKHFNDLLHLGREEAGLIIICDSLGIDAGSLFSDIDQLFPESPGVVLHAADNIGLLRKAAEHNYICHNTEALNQESLQILFSFVIERKETLIQLTETRERYKLLTKATNNIIWDWELLRRRAYWAGAGLSDILGYDQFEIMVDTDFWETNIHPEDKERVITRLDKIFTDAKLNHWEDEYRFLHKDGTYRHIYDRGFIIYRDKLPVRMIGSMENITQRKLAEEASISSEKNYKNLFDYNPLPTFIWDMETYRVMEVNKAALDEYGYTRDEFLSLSVFDLRPVDERENFKRITAAAFANGNNQYEYVFRHLTKTGEPMLMQISSYRVEYNERNAVLVLARNVTEKTALEKKLAAEKDLRQQQITEAVVSAQEKERTEIGKELHDNVNQLLSASRLYIEAARSDENNSENLLTQASEYIMNAIEEIRVLSRALNSPLVNELGLKDSIQNLADDLMAVHKIHIIVNKDNFDEAGLHENFKLTVFRIIQEQVTNILKHSKASEATIGMERTQSRIVLNINDNGIGFDTNMKRKGIGLSNIHSRSALYKGKLSIESQKGKGSQLIVEFPVHEALDDNLKLLN